MDKYSTSLELTSGFKIEVTPLPPYYLDFIDDICPVPELPKRKLILLTGDEFYHEYTKPEVPPSMDDKEEYELYLRYVETERKIDKINKERLRHKRDFLLSNCVKIVDGPINIESEEWVSKIEASLPSYKVPSKGAGRVLAFLKAVVITTSEEAEYILNISAFTEVGMQSIVRALRGFQFQVAGQGIGSSDRGEEGKD